MTLATKMRILASDGGLGWFTRNSVIPVDLSAGSLCHAQQLASPVGFCRFLSLKLPPPCAVLVSFGLNHKLMGCTNACGYNCHNRTINIWLAGMGGTFPRQMVGFTFLGWCGYYDLSQSVCRQNWMVWYGPENGHTSILWPKQARIMMINMARAIFLYIAYGCFLK